MFQVCVLTIAGLFAAIILKKDKPIYATLIVILTSILIALRVLVVLEGAIEELESFGTLIGKNVTYIELLLKMVGITYLCEFASSLCKDSGYGTLSNHIELLGKVMIMLAGLPVMKVIISMLEEMIK